MESQTLEQLYKTVYQNEEIGEGIAKGIEKFGVLLPKDLGPAVKALKHIYQENTDKKSYNTDPITAELISTCFTNTERKTPFLVEIKGKPALTWWGTEIIVRNQYDLANKELASHAYSAFDAALRYVRGELSYSGYFEPNAIET